MKLITTEAAGQVLCHDVTQIIPGKFKGPAFKKGHIITEEDIPVLLSIGKENLYVWEKTDGILHEDEAAAILRDLAMGDNMSAGAPSEGKIELKAERDGLLKINSQALLEVNSTPQMMIATRHGNTPVKTGDKLAGTRIIPLVIEKEKMDDLVRWGSSPQVRKYTKALLRTSSLPFLSGNWKSLTWRSSGMRPLTMMTG